MRLDTLTNSDINEPYSAMLKYNHKNSSSNNGKLSSILSLNKKKNKKYKNVAFIDGKRMAVIKRKQKITGNKGWPKLSNLRKSPFEDANNK